jgi:hypothetical protein
MLNEGGDQLTKLLGVGPDLPHAQTSVVFLSDPKRQCECTRGAPLDLHAPDQIIHCNAPTQ